MTEQAPTAAGTTDTSSVRLVYILYLVGLVFGITGIIGVIMAYINKGESDAIAASHYRFQIRTFWIGFLMMFIGAITSVFIIGWFVFLFWFIWLIVRCVKGMKYLEQRQAHPDPTTWMFG
ncbi:DUF4870 family protein [Marinobacterium mangrovicola]|uniref:Putative membrane protein n=1 Tax=Marinobacterium mangrovicola TaxID=1476959 RepID=A0A4R1G7Q8_9GAMM|nr:hypothetical protein [Marinobacterium mangrovicola]TCK04127.1 putative membrane protein [Marinobacterium mangrovicola]